MASQMEVTLKDFKGVPTKSMSLAVETMRRMSANHRRGFERRWYDNNFFDDGFHFRYVSRETGRIVDLTERSNVNLPQRAIPKASRQIRGVANLLMQLDPVPVVYPRKVSSITFPKPQELEMAKKMAGDTAKKVGTWIEYEWKKQEMQQKLTEMLILTAKHGVSYMQIWPDEIKEEIRTQVLDAFDVYLLGNLNNISDQPFVIKATPQLISEVKSTKAFDEEQLIRLGADNKYASSEIKQGYMLARFGQGLESDFGATVIVNECFVKEVLDDDNWAMAKELSKKTGAMEGKSKGDRLIRHVFTAGGLPLLDEFITLKDYPFVPYTFEPGPLYNVPLIERFIPQNKTLDTIVSRIERFTNTMVAGTWLKRRGEDMQITNLPGGQVLEYSATPPTQANISSIPPFVFNFVQLLEKFIEEQGAATAALGALPQGVKSGVAIEAVKQTEYANLKISTNQLKTTVKQITQKLLEIAGNYFIMPQTVYIMKEGKPDYFDVIGQRGIDARAKVGASMPEATAIRDDYVVDIEVESGLGYTMEGKKNTMQQIANYMLQMAQAGYLTQPAVAQTIQKFLEIFQYGSTSEFMDAMNEGTQTAPINDQQLMQMKVAFAETAKDLGMAGQQKDDQLVNSTKVGVAETLRDMMAGKNPQAQQAQPMPQGQPVQQ